MRIGIFGEALEIHRSRPVGLGGRDGCLASAGDGRIQIASDDDRWSAALVGRNIFNVRTNGAVGGSPFLAPPTISRSINGPRQIGIEFELKM